MAEVGDIFALPLGDGNAVLGQVCAKESKSLALILVFKEKFAESHPPSTEELQTSIRSVPVFMANSFDNFVDNGVWKRLTNLPVALDSRKLPAFRDPIGLPFGFKLDSYDGKYARLAHSPREMFAPTKYSISPKSLENAVKSYFQREKSNPSYDRLLYKNTVPFGRTTKWRERKRLPEPPFGQVVFAKIMDNVLPMTRGNRYHKPLDDALRSRGFGSVVGGGTQKTRDGGIAWIGLDVELSNLSEALEFTRQKLRELGAPAGSVLEYRVGDKQTTLHIN